MNRSTCSIITFIISSFLLVCCNTRNKAQQHKFTNRLIHESSPYLLQHAHNPVNWYPWGEEAFDKAVKENKPVLVSIGYSACHWCHVMEHECFEDTAVANLMNKYFVSIKVDREERPDVDKIYIDAAQMMNGSAGWPLNCLLLPDGKPFFAGTFFPKAQWTSLLKQAAKLWREKPGKLKLQAAQITRGLHTQNLLGDTNKNNQAAIDIPTTVTQWLNQFDHKKGGYHGAPKFPMPTNINMLFSLYYFQNNTEARDIALTTLDHMLQGGIYDQVGGGFARYATDDNWKVPHFEKMLYDNAQLITTYANGYKITKNPWYRQTVSQTVDFLMREMHAPAGGFYSSLDADSQGEEGKFYVWTKKEMDSVLNEDAPMIEAYYQVSERGNWKDGLNILSVTTDTSLLMEHFHISSDLLQQKLHHARSILLKRRALRIRPALDDKMLTAWNSLAIIGLTDAYQAFDSSRYLTLAVETGQHIRQHLLGNDYRLFRNFKDGQANINAFLDDYAFTIQAFIRLYEATFDERWLYDAQGMAHYVQTHFSDASSPFFYYNSNEDTPLISRKLDNADNVIPSANSQMAINLFLLGNYFADSTLLQQSDNMLHGISAYFEDHLSNFTNWFFLYMLRRHSFYEVAVVGPECDALANELRSYFIPNMQLLGGKNEGSLDLLKNKLSQGKTRIYVCKDKLCKLPVTKVVPALQQLSP